jgi:hypothetical protein
MGWRLVYNDNKIDELEYYYEYPTGDTQTIIFSGGSRTIIDNE